MLKKYLELLSKAVSSFKNLGKGNSWADYFQTVGFEFLVLLIGIAIIVGIIVVLFGPYKGTKKIKQFIIGKSKLPLLKNIIGDYNKKIEDIIKNIDKCTDILIDNAHWNYNNKYINQDSKLYTSLIDLIDNINNTIMYDICVISLFQAENISEAQFLEYINDKNKARILEENNYEIYSDLDEFIPSNSLEYLCSDVIKKDYILKEINKLNSIQIKNNPKLIDLARHYYPDEVKKNIRNKKNKL